jgi:hypothetical protein
MLPKIRLLNLFAVSVLALAPVYATTITAYSSLTNWQAATSSYQTIDFEGLTPPNTGTQYPSGVSPNGTGVQFIGISGQSSIQVIDTNLSPWYNFGTNDALMEDMNRANAGSPLPYIHIVLPSAVTALGMDLFSVSPDGLTYTITVAGTQYTVATNARPNTAFWGITSDTAITSVDLALQGTTYNGSSHALLDNFRFGAAGGAGNMSEAPEAGTYLLIGSGLIGLMLLRKSRPVKSA